MQLTINPDYIKYHTRMQTSSWIGILYLVAATLVTAQDVGKSHAPQNLTLYPPSVYLQIFRACSSEKPCTQTEDFRVDPVPKGCCILSVTNGNGLGKDEVRSFEVFLNGKSVLLSDHSPSAHATVAVQTSNQIRMIVTGEPRSKVLVSIDYDPRQSK